MALRLDTLTRSEVQALDPSKCLIFIVVSGLEDHGPHLPLNADLIEGIALAERTAALIEAQENAPQILFYPPAPLQLEFSTSKLAIPVRPHVLRDYLIDTCSGLHAVGFRNFVCFTGSASPRHLTAIEEAGKWFRSKHQKFWKRDSGSGPSLMSACAVLPDASARSESSLWMNPREHGGARDTSVLLAINPGLIRPQYQSLPAQARRESGFSRWIRKRHQGVEGYWGAPGEADPKRGEQLLDDRAREIQAKILAVLKGAHPSHTFKSWYSVIPMNRTLFPIWVLFIVLIALAMAWIGVLLNTLGERAGI